MSEHLVVCEPKIPIKLRIHEASKDMNYSFLSVTLDLEGVLILEISLVLDLRGSYLSLHQPIFQKLLRPLSVH